MREVTRPIDPYSRASISCVAFSMVDESPKWLLAAGKYEDAKKILRAIIKRNKLDPNIDVDGIVEATKQSLLRVSC